MEDIEAQFLNVSLDEQYRKMIDSFSINNTSIDRIYRPCESKFENKMPPKMNIVILVVGTRGDVQPFIHIGKLLKSHGHKVKIGTHGTFEKLVKDNDLLYYDIGGDPKQLIKFMTDNPTLIPSIK